MSNLENDSIKYLEKSLKKFNKYGILKNPQLINAISRKFLLGPSYLLDTNVIKVNTNQVNRVRQLLVEMIEKLQIFKHKNSFNDLPLTSSSIIKKDEYELNLLKLNNSNMSIGINCDNTEINFMYFDVTSQLCNKRINANALILENMIKTITPTFNIEKYFKFNPSIVNLDERYLLMSYRIYIGDVTCNNFTINNCHPWNDFWLRTDALKQDASIKYNYVGLSIVDKRSFNVLNDTLLDIIDFPVGLEDVRLFEKDNNIYLNGGLTVGQSSNSKSSYGDPRILRQVICLLGTKENIIRSLPNKIDNININCINLHESNMEKNWFGYDDIILNPKYGDFFPIKKFKLDLNLKENNINNEYYPIFKDIKTYKCNNLGSIDGNDLIDNLNKIYNRFMYDNKQKLFRISGGSWGVNYDNDIILFIGHIVVYVDKLDYNIIEKQINTFPDLQISKNLYQFIKKRNVELKFKNKPMRYYQVFFKFSKSLNKVIYISNAFNIFEEKNKDSSINFPIGLIKEDDNYIISFGESDYKTILVKIDNNSVEKLFNYNNLDDYKFLTYIKNNKLGCANI
jgi:hypothetical protein